MTPDDRDFEQQRDIGKAFREVADLRGEVRELKTALVGINGRNGLRGELKEFVNIMRLRMDSQDNALKQLASTLDQSVSAQAEETARIDKRIDDAVAWGHNVWERERYLPGGCIGKMALEEFEERLVADMKAEQEEKTQQRRHTDVMAVEMVKSRRAMWAAIVVSLISTAGAIIAAAMK
jgi:hypothetical protein